ncbi:small nuclear ribonucleoprotein G, putative [Entamoeba invadens IP1]|uniref:Small nuclear ribonucleoprotein G n=1 Tax=Entamoeba invadens IP1 TaxID=370355 RepID=A0A0A1UGW9_ENTIV|nr:small nuclear ribonucleoprotein G, putative [Entamoeba invadens IP1]ELP95234.1 small nuclear ribonucleoprotein G, putative [Entamoeba invadens IP1]|eukprot:XP_004262005.1 small nuclear ribonucleoprotein G, putative [Entamoeba invadens IP1]
MDKKKVDFEKPKPELKHYMEKRIYVKIHCNRAIIGVLRGFDEYLNLVLDDAFDASHPENPQKIQLGQILIRGNSVLSLETVDPVQHKN